MNNNNNKEFEFVFDDEALLSQAEENAPKRAPAPRRRRADKKPFPLFYIIYFALVTLALIGIFWAVGFVDTLLAEYESVQPKYKAEEIFAEHFKEPDVAKLLDLSDGAYAVFESRERVIEHVRSQIKTDSITYTESIKNDKGEPTYNVYSDGVRFATFSLVEGEEATEHGFKFFKLGDIRLTVSMPDNSYDFLIPDGYKLYANGIEVSDKYVSGEYFPTDAYKISGGKTGVKYIPYRVSGFLSMPEFKAADKNGTEAELFWSEDDLRYSIPCGSVKIRIPRGYIAYVDLCEVGEQFILEGEEAIPSAYNSFLEKDAEGLNYITYELNGFFDLPKVTVKSGDGTDCIVRYDEEDELFEAYPAYNTALRAEQESGITEIFRKYTLYLMYVNISEDKNKEEFIKKSDLKVYFDASSQAWKQFSSINVTWQFEPTKYEFVDESVSEFIKYPDGSFSCRIKQTYNSWRGSSKYSQSIDKTVFFKPSGNGYLIYNMTNTEVISGMGQPVL